MSRVIASPKSWADRTAVAATPSAPHMPYATPSGIPARRTPARRRNDAT